ncbi:MAG: periplasmic heavy metal sensor [Myxococcota bacterium]|nr:periplasmic heavy metal sensor [Myxococcota bacterium]
MNAKAIAVLIAVFVGGAAAGIGLAPVVRPPHHGPPPLPVAELGLDADQEAKARAIIAAHQPELEQILGEMRPRAQAVHRAIRGELDAILTPAQRTKLDALERERGGPHTER